MTNNLSIRFDNVILFGESIGTIPSIYTAVHRKYKANIKALILLSPISTFVNTDSYRSDVSLDRKKHLSLGTDSKTLFYQEINKIRDAFCPIMVIHGVKDNVIPYSKTLEFVKLLTCEWSTEWYPTSADHNNIYKKYRLKFLSKLSNFIDHVNVYKQILDGVTESADFMNFNRLNSLINDKNEDIVTIRQSSSRQSNLFMVKVSTTGEFLGFDISSPKKKSENNLRNKLNLQSKNSDKQLRTSNSQKSFSPTPMVKKMKTSAFKIEVPGSHQNNHIPTLFKKELVRRENTDYPIGKISSVSKQSGFININHDIVEEEFKIITGGVNDDNQYDN